MHGGFIEPDKPAGTPDNLCLGGDSPPVGSGILATEEWKIPLSVLALTTAQAHQLSSFRTWHALECLSTPFRKSHGIEPGRGTQAAWATCSAESLCSWETLQAGSLVWIDVI